MAVFCVVTIILIASVLGNCGVCHCEEGYTGNIHF